MYCLAASRSQGWINMNTSYSNCCWLHRATDCTVIAKCSDLYNWGCLQLLNEWIFKKKIKVLVWTCVGALLSLKFHPNLSEFGWKLKWNTFRQKQCSKHCTSRLLSWVVCNTQQGSSILKFHRLCIHQKGRCQNLNMVVELAAVFCFYIYSFLLF